MVSLIRQRARERADVRRRRLARSYSALHLQVEKSTLRSLGGFYASLTRAILARVDAIGMNGFSVDEIFVPHDHRGDFLRTMRPAWQRAIGAGIEFESQILGDAKQSLLLAHKGLILQDATSFPSIHVDLSPDLQRKVREYLQERERGVWSHVSATMHDRLRRAIQKGVKEGETFDTMRERLKASLKGMSDAQGLRIARTETTGSLNAGQQWEREEIGVEHKSWVATIDDLVRGADPKDRFNHLAADGQIVENGKPFVVSGQQLMFPGDSSKGASAGNVICCRCAGVSEFVGATGNRRSVSNAKPPNHLTFTGTPTDLSERTWKEIGSGIQNEEHARKIGAILLDEVDKLVAKGEDYAKSVMNSLEQVRKFGHSDSHDYKGKKPRFIQTMKDAERHYPADWLAESTQGPSIRVVKKSRGYFSTGGMQDEIALEGVNRANTATHELMHVMEARLTRNGQKGLLAKLEREFLMRRAAGDPKTLIYVPQPGKPGEWGYRDQFTSHYIGKDYGTYVNHLEVLSMGWEGIMHGLHRVSSDRDLVQFVLGILAGF